MTYEQARVIAENRALNGARAYALANPTLEHRPGSPYAGVTAAQWFSMLDYYCPNGEAV